MSELEDKQIIDAAFKSSNVDCQETEDKNTILNSTNAKFAREVNIGLGNTAMNEQIDNQSQSNVLESQTFLQNQKPTITMPESESSPMPIESVTVSTDIMDAGSDTLAPSFIAKRPQDTTANELLVIQPTTATELSVNQDTATTELSVNQDTAITELPSNEDATVELRVNQDTTTTELPLNLDTTATEGVVNQDATKSKLPLNQNTTASEGIMNQDATVELRVNQDKATSELALNQDTTDTKLIESQDTKDTESPMAICQDTTNTSPERILLSRHSDGPQCLIDKVNSCVEPIIIDDEPSVDVSLKDESPDTEYCASNGSKKKKACELCGMTEAIYTCPGCHVRTCSLPCVKEHKRRFFCNGERNKTAFVDISEYSESHMLNDYRFLEDANRQVYSTKADTGNKRKHNFGGPNHLTKRCKLLVNAAYKRGVKVQMVAQVLSKHKLNTSYYTVRLDLISWHIEWLFVASNTVVKDEKVPENTILIEAARKWANAVNHPELRKPLEDYKKDNLDNSRFLLKVDCLPANRRRYFEMKPHLSIAENLKGHCLTEYPIVVVLPPNYPKSDEFILFSSADIHFMDPANRRHVMTNLQGMDFQTELIAQLMDPKSHIYSTQPDVINID